MSQGLFTDSPIARSVIFHLCDNEMSFIAKSLMLRYAYPVFHQVVHEIT